MLFWSVPAEGRVGYRSCRRQCWGALNEPRDRSAHLRSRCRGGDPRGVASHFAALGCSHRCRPLFADATPAQRVRFRAIIHSECGRRGVSAGGWCCDCLRARILVWGLPGTFDLGGAGHETENHSAARTQCVRSRRCLGSSGWYPILDTEPIGDLPVREPLQWAGRGAHHAARPRAYPGRSVWPACGGVDRGPRTHLDGLAGRGGLFAGWIHHPVCRRNRMGSS